MRMNQLVSIVAVTAPRAKRMLGRTNPSWISFRVNTGCNKRCAYCYSIQVIGRRASLELGYKVVDRMTDWGVGSLAITGGEPLLLGNDLLKLIAYATSKRRFTYLATNASPTLLTEERLRQIVEAGLGIMDIAVDVLRPKPGLEKDLRSIQGNIEMALEAQASSSFQVKLNSVLTSANLEDVEALIHFAKDHRIPIGLHFISRPGQGARLSNFPWLDEGLFFRPADYGKLSAFVDRVLALKGRGYPLANPSWFFKKGLELITAGSHSGWRCLAGVDSLHVDVDGNVFPCMDLEFEVPRWGRISDANLPLPLAGMQQQLAKCNAGCLACACASNNSLTNILPYIPGLLSGLGNRSS